MSRCKWFSTVSTMVLNRKGKTKGLVDQIYMHRQSTEFASPVNTEYWIHTALKTSARASTKTILPFRRQAASQLMIGRRIIFEFSLKSFMLGFTCFPENPETAEPPGRGYVCWAHSQVFARCKLCDKKVLLSKLFSFLRLYFPDSSALFQTNQCKLRPRL